MKEQTKEILSSAADVNDKDAVMGAMFTAGVPFGKLNSLYQSVGIAEGFLVDPKVVKDEILTNLEESDLDSFDTWEQVEATAEQIAGEVNGANAAKVLRLLKAFCKDNMIDLPKQVTTRVSRKKTGKVIPAIVAYINGTEQPTAKGVFEVALPLVKGPKNAYDYCNMYFGGMLACKSGITLEAANELISKMEAISWKDAEVEAPAESAVDTEDEAGDDDLM